MNCSMLKDASLGNDSVLSEEERSRYFKIGAVVALGELLHEGDLLVSAEQRRLVRRFLASFGVVGVADVETLGIKGIYKYSFERLYER